MEAVKIENVATEINHIIETGNTQIDENAVLEVETVKITNQITDLDVQEKKKKKREEKSLEQVNKLFNSCNTTENKLQLICKKYSELFEEQKVCQNTLKQNQKTIMQLIKDKDQLQSEHSKVILTKSKLEGLCRELQKQNKLIKDESLARAKEDDEKRKEVTHKFQTTINDIQQQMTDHYQKNSSLREENFELTKQLKELIEKYEIREKHLDNIFKTKDIESQLFDAKLQQAQLRVTEEKEIYLQEKQKMMQEAIDNQKKIIFMEEQEKQYKKQIEMYTEKYEEFKGTLSKSNSVFDTFKKEMDKMAKKIKKLEKDTSMWKQKWETSNRTLLTMAEEKVLHGKEKNLLENKISKLESLCRALHGGKNLVPPSFAVKENVVLSGNGTAEDNKKMNTTQQGGEEKENKNLEININIVPLTTTTTEILVLTSSSQEIDATTVEGSNGDQGGVEGGQTLVTLCRREGEEFLIEEDKERRRMGMPEDNNDDNDNIDNIDIIHPNVPINKEIEFKRGDDEHEIYDGLEMVDGKIVAGNLRMVDNDNVNGSGGKFSGEFEPSD